MFRNLLKSVINVCAAMPDNAAALRGVSRAENPLTDNHFILDNPYDSAAIDRVLWATVQAELKDMTKDETLVVILGEEHSTPSHLMAQAGLLTNLALWRNEATNDPDRQLLFAYEQPYDILAAYTQRLYNMEVSPEQRACLHEQDPNGHLALKTILAHNHYLGAPQSMARVFQTVLRHNIRTCFNDASYGKDLFLRPEDPLARDIARKAPFGFDLSNDNIHIGKPEGTAIRNAVMAERALQDAPRVIVQQTGQAHLFGHIQRGFSYRQSLAAEYSKNTKCRVLGVYFNMPRHRNTAENNVEPQAFRDNPRHIIFANAAEQRFRKPAHSEEPKHLDRLARSYQTEPCPYASNEPLPDMMETTMQIYEAQLRCRNS